MRGGEARMRCCSSETTAAIHRMFARWNDANRDRDWPGPYVELSSIRHFQAKLEREGTHDALLVAMIDYELGVLLRRLAKIERDCQQIAEAQQVALPF